MEKKILALPFVFILFFMFLFPANFIHSQEQGKDLTFQNIIEEIRCGTKPAPIDEIAQIIIGNFGTKPQDYRCIIPGYMLYDVYSQIIDTINKGKEQIVSIQEIENILKMLEILQNPALYFLKQAGISISDSPNIDGIPNKEMFNGTVNNATSNVIGFINGYFDKFKCTNNPIAIKQLKQSILDIANNDKHMTNYYCVLNFEDIMK